MLLHRQETVISNGKVELVEEIAKSHGPIGGFETLRGKDLYFRTGYPETGKATGLHLVPESISEGMLRDLKERNERAALVRGILTALSLEVAVVLVLWWVLS